MNLYESVTKNLRESLDYNSFEDSSKIEKLRTDLARIMDEAIQIYNTMINRMSTTLSDWYSQVNDKQSIEQDYKRMINLIDSARPITNRKIKFDTEYLLTSKDEFNEIFEKITSKEVNSDITTHFFKGAFPSKEFNSDYIAYLFKHIPENEKYLSTRFVQLSRLFNAKLKEFRALDSWIQD